jgi:hypothetical protein
MIEIINNYLTPTQCNSIMKLWNGPDVINTNDNIYHFLGFNLIPHLEKVIDIIPEFVDCDLYKFRIQCTDETITQVKHGHFHTNRYSFVIFLNNNFSGGELIFDEITITPTIGTMVYFTADESHRVADCIGKRFTLVGFLKNDLFKTKRIPLTLI